MIMTIAKRLHLSNKHKWNNINLPNMIFIIKTSPAKTSKTNRTEKVAAITKMMKTVKTDDTKGHQQKPKQEMMFISMTSIGSLKRKENILNFYCWSSCCYATKTFH